MTDFLQKLSETVGADGVRTQEPLSRHATFRIGGPADYLVMPRSEEEISAVLQLCRAYAVPVLVIGNGSNLLFDDAGFRGCIIQLAERFASLQDCGPNAFYATAGISLSRTASYAASRDLTGLEFASGIPGSVGGAVLMDAGAYGGEIAQCVTASRYLDAEKGTVGELSGTEQEFGYRHSVYQDHNWIVLGACFSLHPGDPAEITAKMRDLNARRREKQPLEYPSAGSAFKRPTGDFAGRLIETAGLKGFRVGNAMVSEKHAGFIINAGGATAADVRGLVEAVQERVFRMHGVRLEPEIKFIGERSGWNLSF